MAKPSVAAWLRCSCAPYQTQAVGAGGVDVAGPAVDRHRRLVVVDPFGAGQRVFEVGLEAVELVGQPGQAGGDEPGRDRAAQQVRQQRRGAFHADMAQVGDLGDGGAEVRPVADRAGHPGRWLRLGEVPGRAAAAHQVELGDRQLDRRDVPPLHRGAPLIGCGFVQRLPARRALGRVDPFDLVDVVGGRQPRAFAPGLAAGFASLGPVPLRDGLAPFGLGRRRIRARRQRGVRTVHRQPPPQLGVLRSQPVDQLHLRVDQLVLDLRPVGVQADDFRVVAQLLTLRLDQPVLIGQQPFLAGQQLVLAGNDLTQPRVGRTQPAHLRP